MSVLLLKSVIEIDCVPYFVSLGLQFENCFLPVIEFVNMLDLTASKICLSEWEWQLFMKVNFSIILHYLRTEKEPANATKSREYSTKIQPGTIKYIGRYILHFDKNNQISLYQDNVPKITINEEFYLKLLRFYEIVCLKLEYLKKYRMYANYVYSQCVAYFSTKKKSSVNGLFDSDKFEMIDLPIISYVQIDYRKLDLIICRTIFSEIKTYLIENIYKEVNLKTDQYNSKWWSSDNYLYI